MNTLSPAEKQLITTLTWFRSRYALYQHLDTERKATKESIEDFGQTWMGAFKEEWDLAFISLQEKGIIEYIEEEFVFTEKGLGLKDEVEAETPFYAYEYDHYFSLAENSEAHQRFCERVYGLDLSQHGLIDQDELALLIDRLKTNTFSRVLDVGCGNGRITEYLSNSCDAHFRGVDISGEAISQANQRIGNNAKLKFSVVNINELTRMEGKYDLIISLDTLYYVDDLERVLTQMNKLLNKGGRLMAYFSQWIMDENDAENLAPDNTHLAKVLNAQGLKYTFHELTDSGLTHWKTKLAVLEEMQEIFEKEGQRELWNYRFREAFRYSHWGDKKYSRYFYEVKF